MTHESPEMQACGAPTQAPAEPFTIVICAHNAVGRVGRALDALTRLRYDGPWDVLFVDNASTDGTPAFVRQWETRLPALRIVEEARPGVAYARMRAMRDAGGRHICFVDDDNLLAPDYLEIAAAILRDQPEVGIVAGRSRLLELAPPPPWFASVSTCYAVGEQWHAQGPMPSRAVIWGAGTVLRAQAVRELLAAGFDPVLCGRRGRYQLAGEDAEICLSIMLLGWQGYYASDMVIEHAIEPSRMSLFMLRKTCIGFGLAANAIDVYRGYMQPTWIRTVKHSDVMYFLYILASLAGAALKTLGGDLRARVRYWSLLGSVQGFWLAGLRPSRTLRTAFLSRNIARWHGSGNRLLARILPRLR